MDSMGKLKLLIVLLFCIHLSLYSQTTTVTQFGQIGITCPEYTDNLNRVWNINIPTNRRLRLDYSVRVEHSYDKIRVYSINNSGAAVLQATLTGSTSGTLYSLYPTGKMRIEFITDYSVNCSSNSAYSGFQITIGNIDINYEYDAAGNRIGRTITFYNSFASGLRAGAQEIEEEEIVYSEKLDYSEEIEKSAADIRIYPNPTQGLFTVEIGNISNAISGEIHLMDAKGKTLEKRNISGEKMNFDLNGEAPGAYLMNIRIGEKVSSWKIIKQ
jgi:hypothetical protein